jgi:hypothetical protein
MALCALTSALSAQNLPYPLVTQTTALQVNQASQDGTKIHLTLQNNGTKTVLAFAVRMRSVTAEPEFLPPTHLGILPGSEYNFTFTPPASSDSPAGSTLTLLAALFEDGSGEGDEAVLAQLRQMRRARETQLKRLLPIMDSISAASDDDLSSAITNATNLVSKVPETLEDGTQPVDGAVTSVIRSTRDDFVNQLNRLRSSLPRVGPDVVRKQIAAVKQNHTSVLTNLVREHARNNN